MNSTSSNDPRKFGANGHSVPISEKPRKRQKGFKPELLRIKGITAADEAVAIGIENSLAKFPTTGRDAEILGRVRKSYEKLLTSEPFNAEDFVLSGHELAEFEKIADRDVGRYIAYRYRYNKFPELKIADDFPPCLQIEPTSVCNFRCVMCYQIDTTFSRKSSGHMGFMSVDLFKKCIDQAAGNIEAVTFASRGEPLLHPQLSTLLEYCRGKFLALKLNTNASLLNEENIHALLSSDLQTLVFSIDAASKETYEKIRVNGKYEKLMKNLELFAKIRQRDYSNRKIIVRISGVKINSTQNIDSMHEKWNSFADIIAFTSYNPWQSAYENEPSEVEVACTELWRRMFIWWDGKANPCDFDYKSTLSHWNVNDFSIPKIWTSPRYNELREMHMAKRRDAIEPCRRCIVT